MSLPATPTPWVMNGDSSVALKAKHKARASDKLKVGDPPPFFKPHIKLTTWTKVQG